MSSLQENALEYLSEKTDSEIKKLLSTFDVEQIDRLFTEVEADMMFGESSERLKAIEQMFLAELAKRETGKRSEWKKTFPDKQLQPSTTKEEQPSENDFLMRVPVSWAKITQQDNIREWVWENYIAKGNTTLLSALWKAGKSTFLRCLFLAMHNQEEFAGQPTTKSNVLVVSEEDSGEWADQREGLEDDEVGDILVWSRPLRMKPNLKQWIELIDIILTKCKENDISMVVIDTISTFWPIDNENDAAQILKALVPLNRLTNEKIAVLLVHHFRKGGGDQAQASRGSGALPGFVDNIVEFTRTNNGSSTQRQLETYGRFDQVVPKVIIDLTPEGKYITLGDPHEVSKAAKINKIFSIFESSFDKLSVKNVHDFWVSSGSAITERSVRRYISELVSVHCLSVVEERLVGTKKTPYYSLSENYQALRTTYYPLPMGGVLSAVEQKNGQVTTPKGIANVRSNPIGQEELPPWEDPNPNI